ncbi:uncharacterized protein LY79DRAFT_302272 [Colletotrichum navitas]|uniref:Uncharacterized protein n=1 Tax=Colletotrichum navitas TaxID=681940 RepID=A0AAD8V0Q6_9PEZI|nr:uncharacterized protein LY79DRAFT_302272 [Colletotrichum navitas]KAK1580505.1 hypothetical protein LY79DRAFT_302272 [Colletotrichum navitas]
MLRSACLPSRRPPHAYRVPFHRYLNSLGLISHPLLLATIAMSVTIANQHSGRYHTGHQPLSPSFLRIDTVRHFWVRTLNTASSHPDVPRAVYLSGRCTPTLQYSSGYLGRTWLLSGAFTCRASIDQHGHRDEVEHIVPRFPATLGSQMLVRQILLLSCCFKRGGGTVPYLSSDMAASQGRCSSSHLRPLTESAVLAANDGPLQSTSARGRRRVRASSVCHRGAPHVCCAGWRQINL